MLESKRGNTVFTTALFLISGNVKIDVTAEYIEAIMAVDISAPMYLADVRVSMITEIGLPVALQAQVSSTQKISGEVKGHSLKSQIGFMSKVDLNTKQVF